MSFGPDRAEVKQRVDVVNGFRYVVHGGSSGDELRTIASRESNARTFSAAFTTSYTVALVVMSFRPELAEVKQCLEVIYGFHYVVGAVVVTNFGPDGAEVRRCLDVVNGFHYVAHGGSSVDELWTQGSRS